MPYHHHDLSKLSPDTLNKCEIAAFDQRREAWEHLHNRKNSIWPIHQKKANLQAAEMHLAFILELHKKIISKRNQPSSKTILETLTLGLQTSDKIQNETSKRPPEDDRIREAFKELHDEIKKWFEMGRQLASSAGLPHHTFQETIESLNKLSSTQNPKN